MDNARVVLVETSHPGNIGAAARAMKTMGLTDLVLVSPLLFPHPEATARASGAEDLLSGARVVPTLDDALAGCEFVLGASARQRSIPAPMFTPREACEKVASEYAGKSVALVFGRERTGLDNEELDRCHSLVTIPANPEYSSLNLAAAVQVLCYEMRVAHLQPVGGGSRDQETRLATADEMAQLYEHLERVMLQTGFLDPENPKQLMRRLRRLFNRAQPDANELNILRGLLSSFERPTGPKHRA